MPSPSGATAKYGFAYPYELDIPDIPTWGLDLAQGIENIIATDYQNILSNRPAAGKTGRYFYAYDTLQLFRDNGTGWTQVGALPLQGTFASIPAAGNQGSLYFATDTHALYRDNGSTWLAVMPAATSVAGPAAFGDAPVVGTALPYAHQDHSHGLPYPSIQVAAFTSSGTWTVPAGVTNIDLLVVAAGGGGESDVSDASGAGGGQVLRTIQAVTPGEVLTVTIGAGGAGGSGVAGAGASGGNSSVIGTGVSVTAVGGGGAASSAGNYGGLIAAGWPAQSTITSSLLGPGVGSYAGDPNGTEPWPGFSAGGGSAYATRNFPGGTSGGVGNAFGAGGNAPANQGGGGGGSGTTNGGNGGSGYVQIGFV